jgi:hypothetical protein
MIRTTDYQTAANCIEIANGDASVIISTEFGPRILHYSLDDGENIFGWHPEAQVKTDLGIWKPYGGHRLWMAPENMPLSYAPDNGRVQADTNGDLTATFTAEVEAVTGIQKEMTITLAPTGSGVTVEHRITNRGESEIKLALWALTILKPGGEIVIPNEPHAAYSPDNLLPVRTLTQWSYTDFTDPRWTFTTDSIRLRVDENIASQQKFGVLNKQGWAAYECDGYRFTKRAPYDETAIYPDMNSNFEAYTSGGFAELETLSPLHRLLPGDFATHKETWELKKID